MGLGKTVQCIALVSHLIAQKCEGPFLVVAPLSTIPNWYSEFRRFTPLVPVIVHHGSKEERARKARKINRQTNIGPWIARPVVLTTYEMIIQDRRLIGHLPWKCLIVDEGHRIKNMNCRLIRELKLFNSCNRLLLTGTPLQNNLTELWSLLNFLLPEIFDDLASFESWFDMSLVTREDGKEEILRAEREGNVLSMLHRILEPFLLRRLKADVHLDIPPKREVLVYAPLTSEQQELYKSAVDRTIEALMKKKNGEVEDDNGIDAANIIEEEEDAGGRRRQRAAKKDINYAFFDSGEREGNKISLLKSSDKANKGDEEEEEEKEEDDAEWKGLGEWYKQICSMTDDRERSRVEIASKGQKSNLQRLQTRNIMMLMKRIVNHPYLLHYPIEEMEKPNERVVNLCGKMMILDQLLVNLRKGGHKVLIFSQMTQMLDIIADYLDYRGFDHSRLDGSMKLEDRHDHIQAFNTDPDRFVFLLSTRAGGLGLNLMTADTVIIYDSDWNPQCDLQAQDRAHRLGQKRPVIVYRFVAGNTIDQRIVERAAAKRRLEKMVIRKGRFQSAEMKKSAAKGSITSQELLALLQSRDQDAEVAASQTTRLSGKVRWTMGDKDCEKLLDRSDLYLRWEEERKERARLDALAKEDDGGDGKEGAGKKKTPSGDEEKDADAAEESAAIDKLIPQKSDSGLFSVVETTSGVSFDDLV